MQPHAICPRLITTKNSSMLRSSSSNALASPTHKMANTILKA
jgi:hypothetical protein